VVNFVVGNVHRYKQTCALNFPPVASWIILACNRKFLCNL